MDCGCCVGWIVRARVRCVGASVGAQPSGPTAGAMHSHEHGIAAIATLAYSKGEEEQVGWRVEEEEG